MFEFWSAKIVKKRMWGRGKMEYWNDGKMEYWRGETGIRYRTKLEVLVISWGFPFAGRIASLHS